MMFLASGLLLTFMFLGTLYYSIVVKRRELFHPINTISFFYFLFNAPFVLFLAIDSERYFPLFFVDKIKDLSLEEMIFNYSIIQIIFFVAIILGIKSNPLRNLSVLNRWIPHISSSNKLLINLGVILSVLIGAICFIWFMYINGGLLNVLLNLHLRTKFTNGNGYLLNGLSLIQISLFFYLYSKKGKELSTINKIALLVSSLLLIVLFSSLGGRKASIFIIFYILFLTHYFIGKVRFKPAQVTIVAIAISFYMIVVPIIRKQGGVDDLVNNTGVVASKIVDKGADILIGQISYVPQYTFIVNYFNTQNAWYGSSYGDIITAPIPRSWYPEKPPVDDGVYISNIINRRYLKPPVRFDKLYPVSYPGETLGISYANFLLPGVIFFGFFLGGIYRVTYSMMISSNMSFINTYLYVITIMNFQFSNLRIVNYFSILLFNGLFIIFVFFLSKIIKGK